MPEPNQIIKLVAQKPSTTVIEQLQCLLKKAEVGEIISLAAGYEYADGESGCWASHEKGANRMKLIGELERIKYLMMKRVDNNGEIDGA